MNKMATSKRNKSLKGQNKSLRRSLVISRAFGTIMTVMFCILGVIYIQDHNNLTNQIVALQEEYNNLSTDYNILVSKYDSFNNTIAELITISDELDQQNQSLVASNEEYYNELQEYKSREELYDKYDYALIDECGNRTDITYDQLETLEDLVENSSINDEDLFLSWIMTESKGKEDAQSSTSTAKGYGQFLNGTSKFVYTSLLGKSDWNPNIALDGETNLEMMVAYVDYLYEQTDQNLYETIKRYRGKDDITSYVACIDSYLAEKDKSVYMIASSLN